MQQAEYFKPLITEPIIRFPSREKQEKKASEIKTVKVGAARSVQTRKAAAVTTMNPVTNPSAQQKKTSAVAPVKAVKIPSGRVRGSVATPVGRRLPEAQQPRHNRNRDDNSKPQTHSNSRERRRERRRASKLMRSNESGVKRVGRGKTPKQKRSQNKSQGQSKTDSAATPTSPKIWNRMKRCQQRANIWEQHRKLRS